MKISLFQGILIGVFGLAALVGLLVFSTYRGGGPGAITVGSVTIWGTLPKENIDATITALAPANPAFKDVTYVEKNEATLSNDLASAIATGGAPDLVLASQEELLPLSKFIIPIPQSTLSPSTFVNTFIEGASIFTAPNGAGFFGMPFLADPLVLYANRTILSSSGVARPPETWEAMLGLVPRVALLTPSRQITRALIALGTYDNVKNARAILSTLFRQTAVPISGFSSAGTLIADLGETTTNLGEQPGKAVVTFYTQFADPSKLSYTWNASLRDSQTMFLSGDLALYLGYVSEAPFLRSANPNIDFIVAPTPEPATASAKSVYGRIYAFSIPRGAKNPAGAYEIAALLTNSEEQAVASANTGLVPVTLNQLAKAPTDPIAETAYGEALYTSGWLSPAPDVVDTIFSGMIKDVISGHATYDTALTSAEQTLTAKLQQ